MSILTWYSAQLDASTTIDFSTFVLLNHNVVPSKALFLQVQCHVVQRQLVYLATTSPARLIAKGAEIHPSIWVA